MKIAANEGDVEFVRDAWLPKGMVIVPTNEHWYIFKDGSCSIVPLDTVSKIFDQAVKTVLGRGEKLE